MPEASVTRLAFALGSLGRQETAIALLRRAQRSHSDDFWVNTDLGGELMADGKPEEAVRFFAVATGVRPRSGLAVGSLGKALLRSGQPGEAAATLRELTRLRPDDAHGHVSLGSALLRLDDREDAESEFREAKRLKPDDWMVRDQIAWALVDTGDWHEAIAEFRETVRRFPSLAIAHKSLGHALLETGHTDEAVAELRTAIRLDPRCAPAYVYLGCALIESGDYTAALDALARPNLGPPHSDPKLNPSTLASRAEHRLSLEARLAAVEKEVARPADAREVAEFARLAFARRRYETSARLWSQAFTFSPLGG